MEVVQLRQAQSPLVTNSCFSSDVGVISSVDSGDGGGMTGSVTDGVVGYEYCGVGSDESGGAGGRVVVANSDDGVYVASVGKGMDSGDSV